MTNEAHLESLQLTPEAEALAAALAAWDGTLAAWERLSALAAPSANVDAVRDAGEDLARALGAIPEAEDADGARRTAEDARGQLARALADVRPLAVSQAAAESPPPREWMLWDWLPTGRVAIFTGKQGWGKSHIGFMLAAAIAAGRKRWIRAKTKDERAPLYPAKAAPVVWATWEDEPAELWRRLERIQNATGGPLEVADRLKVVDLARYGPLWESGGHIATKAKLTGAGAALRALCESAKARLLVIDPLAAAYAGDENARGLVRAYMSDWDGWGREAGCAVMMIAHPPKSAHETGVTYSGSTDWEAAARTAWFIGQADESAGWARKKKEANAAAGVKPGRALYLEVTKSNYGPPPRRVWLDKDPDGLPFEVRPPTWADDYCDAHKEQDKAAAKNGGDTYDNYE